MPTKRRKFMSGEAYAARIAYLRQWEDYLAAPQEHPEPDHALRYIDASAGIKTSFTHARDQRDGALVVGVTFDKKHHYFLDPLDDLALDIGTAFGGMRLSSWHGGAYPCIPNADPDGPLIRLSRLFMDVGPGGAALRQDCRAGFFARHSLRRRDLAPIAAAHWRSCGCPTHAPVQRDDFIDASAEAWVRNYWAAGIRVALVDHARNIHRAFRAADLAFATIGAPEPDHGFTSLGASASAVVQRAKWPPSRDPRPS